MQANENINDFFRTQGVVGTFRGSYSLFFVVVFYYRLLFVHFKLFFLRSLRFLVYTYTHTKANIHMYQYIYQFAQLLVVVENHGTTNPDKMTRIDKKPFWPLSALGLGLGVRRCSMPAPV